MFQRALTRTLLPRRQIFHQTRQFSQSPLAQQSTKVETTAAVEQSVTPPMPWEDPALLGKQAGKGIAPPSTKPATGPNQMTGEVNGPRGPEPTRYGDFERAGRCYDF
jgi:hypothetical protein